MKHKRWEIKRNGNTILETEKNANILTFFFSRTAMAFYRIGLKGFDSRQGKDILFTPVVRDITV